MASGYVIHFVFRCRQTVQQHSANMPVECMVQLAISRCLLKATLTDGAVDVSYCSSSSFLLLQRS